MRALLAFVLLILSIPATATERYYGEYVIGTSGIRHTDLQFRTVEGRLTLGGYFAKGLGAEVSFGGPFRVGEDEGFTVQVENLATLSMRFESPPAEGLSAYILLGVSRFAVSQRGVNSLGGARTVRENFQGASFTIGLRQQLTNSRLSLVGGYQLHYVDQPIDIDAWTFGVRAAW